VIIVHKKGCPPVAGYKTCSLPCSFIVLTRTQVLKKGTNVYRPLYCGQINRLPA